MKIRQICVLATTALLGVYGCSGDPAKASPEEVKQFGGGPPPANYMDAANKATAAAREKNAPPTKP